MSQGPGPHQGAPTVKAKDARGAWRRLIRELRPERPRIIAVVVLTTASVLLNVLAPRVLGRATNIIYEGVMGSRTRDCPRAPGARGSSPCCANRGTRPTPPW